eukprot:scaffold8196_cov100-Cylindrotheca_fusiformis.AAC.1
MENEKASPHLKGKDAFRRQVSFRNLDARMSALDGTVENLEEAPMSPSLSSIDTTPDQKATTFSPSSLNDTTAMTTDPGSTDSKDQNVASPTSFRSRRRQSRNSLSFIGRKSLYKLALGMGDLEDEIDDIREDAASSGSPRKSSLRNSLLHAFSRTFSDEGLDDLQDELALADKEYDDMVSSAATTPKSSMDENDDDDESVTLSPRTARFLLKRLESDDFPLPSTRPQPRPHPSNGMSLSESMEGLEEEMKEAERRQSTTGATTRSISSTTDVPETDPVVGENRVLPSNNTQDQPMASSFEGKAHQVQDKVESLIAELNDAQTKHAAEMHHVQKERILLEQKLADRQGKLDKFEAKQKELLKIQEAKHVQLEQELASAKEEGESIKSVYTNMVQMHQRENTVLQTQIKKLNKDFAAEKARFEQETKSMERKLLAQGKAKERLEAQHKADMASQLEAKRALEKELEDLKANHQTEAGDYETKQMSFQKKMLEQEEMIDNLKDQHAKDLQALEASRDEALALATESRSALEQKLQAQTNKIENLESQHKVQLEAERNKSLALENRLGDAETNHSKKVKELEQEKQSLISQLSTLREAMEQMETDNKKTLDAQLEKVVSLEQKLVEVKSSKDQQLEQVKEENDSFKRELTTMQETVERTTSQHEKVVSKLQEEKASIEKQMKEMAVSNDSLAPVLKNQEEEIKRLRAQHKNELKAQETKTASLLGEMNDLKKTDEGRIGEAEKRHELLMQEYGDQQEKIKQLKTQHEAEMKEQIEQKDAMEKQVRLGRDECEKLKNEKAQLVGTLTEDLKKATLQLNELKAMNKVDAENAKQECQSLTRQLADRQTQIEELQANQKIAFDAEEEKRRSLSKQLEDMHSAYNKVKADYAKFVATMEESGALSDQDTRASYASRDSLVQHTNNSELKTEDSSSRGGMGWPLAMLLLLLLGISCYFFGAYLPLANKEDGSLRAQFHDEKTQLESKISHTERTVFELTANLTEAQKESMKHKKHAAKLDREVKHLQSENDGIVASSKSLKVQLSKLQHECQGPPVVKLQSAVDTLEQQLKEAREENTRTKQSLQTTTGKLSSVESDRNELVKKAEAAEALVDSMERQVAVSKKETDLAREQLAESVKKAKALDLEKAAIEARLLGAEKQLSKESSTKERRTGILPTFQKQIRRVSSGMKQLGGNQIRFLGRIYGRVHGGAVGKAKQIKGGTMEALQATKRKASHIVRSDRGKINSEESAWLVLR